VPDPNSEPGPVERRFLAYLKIVNGPDRKYAHLTIDVDIGDGMVNNWRVSPPPGGFYTSAEEDRYMQAHDSSNALANVPSMRQALSGLYGEAKTSLRGKSATFTFFPRDASRR
jgi:hypothetical protein